MSSQPKYFKAQELIDASPSLVSVIDADDWVVKYQNKTSREALGEITAKSCHWHIAGNTSPCSFCRARESIAQGRTTSSEVPRPDGTWLLVQFAPVYSDGKTYVLETITDITEQKEREQEYLRLKKHFEGLARTDPLTETLNRRGFLEAAARLCRRTSSGVDRIFILMMDLDHFKGINDALGHEAGDAVLAHVGGLLWTTCRIGDLICRWGGEEFALMLEPGVEDAAGLAERIRMTVELNPPSLPEAATVAPTVTISIGIGSFLVESFSEERLKEAIAEADRNLYQAKTNGRNCVVPSGP